MSARRRPPTRKPTALVAFGAPWAPPWALLQPALDRVEQEGVPVTRVDVETDEASAEKWRIIAVPTIIVMRGGEERKRLIGAVSYDDLRSAAGVR